MKIPKSVLAFLAVTMGVAQGASCGDLRIEGQGEIGSVGDCFDDTACFEEFENLATDYLRTYSSNRRTVSKAPGGIRRLRRGDGADQNERDLYGSCTECLAGCGNSGSCAMCTLYFGSGCQNRRERKLSTAADHMTNTVDMSKCWQRTGGDIALPMKSSLKSTVGPVYLEEFKCGC